jgi:hypothetical protein
MEALASGILLPGGPGLLDPCEKDPADAAGNMLPQQREDITASAQVCVVNSTLLVKVVCQSSGTVLQPIQFRNKNSLTPSSAGIFEYGLKALKRNFGLLGPLMSR